MSKKTMWEKEKKKEKADFTLITRNKQRLNYSLDRIKAEYCLIDKRARVHNQVASLGM